MLLVPRWRDSKVGEVWSVCVCVPVRTRACASHSERAEYAWAMK